MIQISLTPAAGKRLIAKSIIKNTFFKNAIHSGTVVIIAGSTNGYVAEEALESINQAEGFNRNRFFRGITLPPSIKTTDTGRLPDESLFPGDVVIANGKWLKGKTIFDVIDNLKSGDVIIKGANCINTVQKKAGILIGHPKGGTIGSAIQAVIGKRVKLILPVGLEKRISGDIDTIANLLNSPDSTGPRLLPVTGDIITEIEAIEILYGVKATLVAAGGVGGAEGSIWLAIEGKDELVTKTKHALNEIAKEEPFILTNK